MRVVIASHELRRLRRLIVGHASGRESLERIELELARLASEPHEPFKLRHAGAKLTNQLDVRDVHARLLVGDGLHARGLRSEGPTLVLELEQVTRRL